MSPVPSSEAPQIRIYSSFALAGRSDWFLGEAEDPSWIPEALSGMVLVDPLVGSGFYKKQGKL